MLVSSWRSQVESSVNISAVLTQGKDGPVIRACSGILNLFLLHPPSPRLHLHSRALYTAGKAAEKQNLHVMPQTAAESPAVEALPLEDAERWTDGLFTCQVPFPAWKVREKQPLILLS